MSNTFNQLSSKRDQLERPYDGKNAVAIPSAQRLTFCRLRVSALALLMRCKCRQPPDIIRAGRPEIKEKRILI